MSLEDAKATCYWGHLVVARSAAVNIAAYPDAQQSFTPNETRQFAHILLAAADVAEGKSPEEPENA